MSNLMKHFRMQQSRVTALCYLQTALSISIPTDYPHRRFRRDLDQGRIRLVRSVVCSLLSSCVTNLSHSLDIFTAATWKEFRDAGAHTRKKNQSGRIPRGMQVANPTNMPPRNLLIIVSSAVSTILGLSATSSVGTFVIDQYYLTQNTLRTALVRTTGFVRVNLLQSSITISRS